jgi:hypothetical protein
VKQGFLEFVQGRELSLVDGFEELSFFIVE